VELIKIPAAGRFISIEPILGPVDLREFLEIDRVPGGEWERSGWRPALDWVIVGGETGPGARPVKPGWVRTLRDQCLWAGVPFFFKSWGEWAKRHDLLAGCPGLKGRLWHTWDPDTSVCRVGKKKAGRLLDGQEWSQFPGEREKTTA
jgi:protein gp37